MFTLPSHKHFQLSQGLAYLQVTSTTMERGHCAWPQVAIPLVTNKCVKYTLSGTNWANTWETIHACMLVMDQPGVGYTDKWSLYCDSDHDNDPLQQRWVVQYLRFAHLLASTQVYQWILTTWINHKIRISWTVREVRQSHWLEVLPGTVYQSCSEMATVTQDYHLLCSSLGQKQNMMS